MQISETEKPAVPIPQYSRLAKRQELLHRLHQLKMQSDLYKGHRVRWSFYLALTDMRYRESVLATLSRIQNTEIADLSKRLCEMTEIKIDLNKSSRSLGSEVYVKEYNGA